MVARAAAEGRREQRSGRGAVAVASDVRDPSNAGLVAA
jgi:hypothetical protein